MPTLSWQRRRVYSEHAAAIEHEAAQARSERRRPRKIRALEDPQSRHFPDEASLRAFAASLRARHPDVAITIAPDKPKPHSLSQSRLDEVSGELWPIPVGSNAR